jgi:DNA-binding SARP family transcriptional activator
MAAALLAFVLGPVQVQRDGVAVELGGARQRAVLARLLAARGAVVTADRLIEDVWGPEPPPGVLSSLHASVSRLRRALEPDRANSDSSVLLSRGGGYSLAVPTDVERLAQAVARAGDSYLAEDSSVIVAALRAALDGWQGEPYAELGEQSWLVGERGRCHELRLVALERLASAHLAAGEPVEASLAVLSAFGTDPGRERMAALLAAALFRQSRQAEALAVCRRARQVLAEQHGLDPAVELRQVEAAILGQDEGLMPSTIPAAAPVRQRAGGVPDGAGLASALGGHLSAAADPNVLVGREHELTVVSAAMSLVVSGQPRIIVLTGEAGIGKTSLAQAVAGDLSERGWAVCWGRCSGSGGAPALWPWLQVLRGLAGVRRLPVSLRSLVDGESATPADVQGRACGWSS